MPSSLQLKKIQKYKLGIRSGTDIKGAAYAMSDFGDDLNNMLNGLRRIKFILNPERGDHWERQWCSRYYNSVLMIKQLGPQGTILLLSGANESGGGRYHPGNGKGDGTTFMKCNRLPSDSTIYHRLTYNTTDSVPDILLQITQALDRLDDPGNEFF